MEFDSWETCCIITGTMKSLLLCREVIAVCCEIHTKHINTLCWQNVELLNVRPGGTYSNHWALEGIVKDSVRPA
jgi:hypothetical protein